MTKCNRCNSEVSFKKDDISNEDYYCACLECDEDLFKIETYETKGENEKMNYQQKKEDARQKAIDIQIEISERSLSHEEMSIINEYLYKLGKRYGLIKEFKENCLI